MTNSYYSKGGTYTRNTTARAEAVSTDFTAVEEGFDLLPAPTALHGDSFNYAADTGSANAYAVTVAGGPATPTAGTTVKFFAANANTGASTLTYTGSSAWSAKGLRRNNGDALVSGDIRAGQLVEAIYNGSYFAINAVAHADILAAETYASNASSSATAAAASASAASSSASSASSSASSASSSASSASSSASGASSAQTAAETARTAAEAAQTAAETAQSAAETAETNAASSATAASSSASSASSSAISASGSASTASTAATNASTALTSFYDSFIGPAASDPVNDLNGDPVSAGQFYWNTTSSVLRFYNGSSWQTQTVSTTADVTSFTPAGDIAATDVQAAIEELDGEKISGAGTVADGAVVVFDGTSGGAVAEGPAIGTSANNLVQLNGSGKFPSSVLDTAVDLITETVVSTGVASVEFTGLDTSTYQTFVLEVTAASHDDAGSQSFLVQVSPDSGSTWRTTGYTSHAARFSGSFAAITNTSGAIQNQTAIGAGDEIYFVVSILGMSSASELTGIQGQSSHYRGTAWEAAVTSGSYTTAEAHDSVRVIATSGNIDAGIFRIYGLK